MRSHITILATIFCTLLTLPALARATQFEISWDPNPAPDISAYSVHYGTTSGAYTTSTDVGLATSFTLDDPADGQTYYLAITAHDLEGLQSDYSAEQSFTATAPQDPDDPGDSGDPADGSTVPTDGLTGYWSFDHADGTRVADDSGRAVDGQLDGAVIDSGYIDGAVRFDGIDDLVELSGDDFAITTQMTIATWLYIEGDTATRQVVAQRGDYAYPFIISVENNRVRTCLRTDGTHYLNSASQLESEQWYHVAVTFGNGQRTVYINGTADATDSVAGTLYLPPDQPTTVGATPKGSYPLYGMVDELRIYNRCLSAAEIATLHDAPAHTGSALLAQEPVLLTAGGGNTLSSDPLLPQPVDPGSDTLFWVFHFDFSTLGFTMASSPVYPYLHALQYRRPGDSAWQEAPAGAFLWWVWVENLQAIGSGDFEVRALCSTRDGETDYSHSYFITIE